ncbi:MAG: ABC transporter permease [Deltaproteobacteria bacterium]|nr:ABC transporter permease [Deltaproteobacteria bacterium]
MSEGLLWQSIKSVWLRNSTMYSKTWKLNILPNFFEPVFFLIGLGLGVGFYIQQIGGVPYPVFLAPGLIAIAAMNGASFESTYNVYVRMNYNRTYDAIIATPVNEHEIIIGELLWSITRAMIYGGIFYLITFLFGIVPSVWSPGILLVLILVGYLFATIGMAYAFTIPTIDLFSVYFTLFLTPLYIFSDTFFPLQERLGSWAWIAEFNPLFHCVRLNRAFATGHFSPILIWDVVYILGVGFIFQRLALKQFKKRIHQPAR